MSETSIVGENIEVIQTRGPRSAFNWSVVIAGALAAWAVAFIFISLGTGIGLAVTSPYSGPSAGTMGIAGAIWLLLSETMAFTTGGYLAARLRIRDHIPGHETKFRDAAHGFMAWVIGACLMGLAIVVTGAFTAKTAADVAGVAAGSAAVTAAASNANTNNNDPTAYYVDRLFRANPGASTNAPAAGSTAAPAGDTAQTPGQAQSGTPANQQMSGAQRAEATRIMVLSLRNGSMSDTDKDYLARLVAARTGMSQQEAAQRVTDVQNQAAQAARDAAEKARKAGAYLSFWSFMALLFGAVAATLAGILGGELRDEL